MDPGLRGASVTAPVVDLTFPHRWQAEILAARPPILPPRHFVYPREAEEVERGALEVLIRPLETVIVGVDPPNSPQIRSEPTSSLVTGHDFSRAANAPKRERALAPAGRSSHDQPFLATCALGFHDPIVPTGVWSTPEPEKLCAVSGGYAYIIDTAAPQRFTMIPHRPVLEVRAATAENLLLFLGHRSILAWGAAGQAWESGKLSDEGVTITAIVDGMLHGIGWEMTSDTEAAFSLDLRTGAIRR